MRDRDQARRAAGASDDGGTTVARDAAQLVPSARAVLLHPPLRRSREREPDRSRVALILSMSTDGGKTSRAIADRRQVWDYHSVWWSADGNRVARRRRRRRDALGRRRGALVAAVRPAVLAAVPYRPRRRNPALSRVRRLAGQRSWCGPSTSENGVGVLNRDWAHDRARRRHVVGVRSEDADPVWSTDQPRQWPGLPDRPAHESGVGALTGCELDGLNTPARHAYRFNWDKPVAFDGDGPALTAGNVVFRSADRGETWQPISPDLTRNDPIPPERPGGPIAGWLGCGDVDTILYVASTPPDRGLIWVTHRRRPRAAHPRQRAPWATSPRWRCRRWGRVSDRRAETFLRPVPRTSWSTVT